MARPRKDGKPPRETRHVNLNDRFVGTVKPQARRAIFFDRALKGFALQVEPSGHNQLLIIGSV